MVTNNGDANNLSGQGAPNPKLIIPNKNLLNPAELSMALAIEQWCNNLVSPEPSAPTSPFPTFTGPGAPEGVQTGAPPDSYQDTTTGAIYSKADGSGNTGWVLVGGNGSSAVPGISADTSGGTVVTATGFPGLTLQANYDGGVVLIEANDAGGVVVIEANGAGGAVVIEANDGAGMNAGKGRATIQGDSVSILSTLGSSQIQMDHPTAGDLLLIATNIGLYGAPAVGQAGAIGSPAGGGVVDVEARVAIDSILAVLGQAAGGIGITA
jgi:hypothetical protein